MISKNCSGQEDKYQTQHMYSWYVVCVGGGGAPPTGKSQGTLYSGRRVLVVLYLTSFPIHVLRETSLIVATIAWKHSLSFLPSKLSIQTRSHFSEATTRVGKSLKSTDFMVRESYISEEVRGRETFSPLPPTLPSPHPKVHVQEHCVTPDVLRDDSQWLLMACFTGFLFR